MVALQGGRWTFERVRERCSLFVSELLAKLSDPWRKVTAKGDRVSLGGPRQRKRGRRKRAIRGARPSATRQDNRRGESIRTRPRVPRCTYRLCWNHLQRTLYTLVSTRHLQPLTDIQRSPAMVLNLFTNDPWNASTGYGRVTWSRCISSLSRCIVACTVFLARTIEAITLHATKTVAVAFRRPLLLASPNNPLRFSFTFRLSYFSGPQGKS